MSDIMLWIMIIFGFITLTGLPAIEMFEEEGKHGYLHGQGKFMSVGIGNVILLFILFYFVKIWGFWIWVALNWFAIITAIYKRLKR